MEIELKDLDLENMSKEEMINLIGKLFDKIDDLLGDVRDLQIEIDRMSDDKDDFTYSMGLY